jgi:hypothetical protein
MRRTLTVLALALAVVAYAGTRGLASTGPATIRITDLQVADRTFGDGVGSREIVRTELYQRTSPKSRLGGAAMVCTWVAARQRSCTTTFTLPKGTIVASGVLQSRLLYELAIVGGTGLYDNARGTLLNTTVKLSPRRDLLLFRLAG